MARPLRNQAPDLIRHVMSRGNGRMCIFLDEADYRHFVSVLGRIVEKFALECWNYCLMPNHYHATLQPSRPNLSEAIRRLNGDYAQWWNQRHERVGHVFQGRFKAQVVDREAYLVTVSRYVVLNPVRAGLVERPEDWPWSSFRATAGYQPAPAFLDTSTTLHLFGEGDESVLRARFAASAMARPDDAAAWDRIRSKERVLGGEAFKAMVAATGESVPLRGRALGLVGPRVV